MNESKLDSISIVTIPPPPPPLPSQKVVLDQPTHDQRINWEEDLRRSFARVNQASIYTGYYVYNHVDSIIQHGPTCGIVALVMAARLLGVTLDVDECLLFAQSCKISRHGEMFSVQRLGELAEGQLSDAKVTLLKDLNAHKFEIIDCLINGWPILVPYDCDRNHEPTIKGGYRAHWAVLLGFCILDKESSQGKDLIDSRLQFKESSEAIKSKIEKCPNSLLMVLARQGKSRYLHWWSFETLCQSNQGLVQVNPQRLQEYLKRSDDQTSVQNNFIVPENGDLRQSLANQFLMIKPKKL